MPIDSIISSPNYVGDGTKAYGKAKAEGKSEKEAHEASLAADDTERRELAVKTPEQPTLRARVAGFFGFHR